MLKRGLEIGLSTGDFFLGFLGGVHYVQKSLLSGMKLSSLKRECDYYLRLIDSSNQKMCKTYMGGLNDTIAKIINSEATVDSEELDTDEVGDIPESQTFYRVLQCFWLGHYDRCLYFSEKYFDKAGE